MSRDQLIVDISKMLRQISDATPSPSIRRVSYSLRSTSDKAYDPMVISIGPLHHGKGHLKDMQNLKMRYLKDLVGDSLGIYVKAIWEMEQAARACYAETIELKSDEFVQMLLLDGSFIIRFLRKYDYTINLPEFGNAVTLILRDLLLFENQIPLCVLQELFNLSRDSNNDRDTLGNLIRPFLFESPAPDVSSSGAEHLLALVHYAKTSSFHKKASSFSSEVVENIRSASELKEAGVIFNVAALENSSWLDITFKNKIIHLPAMEISDVTEPLFKNMIAYEYYLPSNKPRYFTDYAFFLQCLVHSSKDAELLRRMGIIWLGGDDRVYEVIVGLGTNAQPSANFPYYQVFCDLNRHCKLRRNKWLAVLRRNYFNNPWTAISLFAAAVLLTASIVQMVYAILSYHDRD